ncbi:MAG: glutamate-5-semialdehyde dehydrogenase [Phycisphaerales bacterium]|nr:glutamate-5-semialdehyde dehydrogenase [Phycisphaerales bacterium]
MSDFQSYVERLGRRAREASRRVAVLSGQARREILRRIADSIRQGRGELLEANAKDVQSAEQAKLPVAMVERLKLNDKRIAAMADGVEQIAAQVDPVGQVIEGYIRPNGLRIQKVRVPIGVVLFFYESRPNVTSDAAALCLKSGNAIILRGGKEAFETNRAIVRMIHQALKSADEGLVDAVQLVESTDRALVPLILKQDRTIDLVIPRGGESLIRAVVADSTIPVLKHFTGNCHIYIDRDTRGMEQQVRQICVNAKTSYPGGGVCNAVEHLLFHREAAERLLKNVCEDLAAKGVEIHGDERTRVLYPDARAATDEDWDTEYLALVVGVKVVDSMEEAIGHINEHGSHHTDAILTDSKRSADEFAQRVDSASVMINASTRFADGGEYGLGAEIGISTDKLHARGPMGATDLTTSKWIVTGEGHCRG